MHQMSIAEEVLMMYAEWDYPIRKIVEDININRWTVLKILRNKLSPPEVYPSYSQVIDQIKRKMKDMEENSNIKDVLKWIDKINVEKSNYKLGKFRIHKVHKLKYRSSEWWLTLVPQERGIKFRTITFMTGKYSWALILWKKGRKIHNILARRKQLRPNGKKQILGASWSPYKNLNLNRSRQCNFEGCSEPVRAKGWCNNHYFQWYHRKKNNLNMPMTPTGDVKWESTCRFKIGKWSCPRSATPGNLCASHAAAEKGNRELTKLPEKHCKKAKCDLPYMAAGLCRKHKYDLDSKTRANKRD